MKKRVIVTTIIGIFILALSLAGCGKQSTTQKQSAKLTSSKISAASFHNLALKSDGTVVGWGDIPSFKTNVPEGLKDVVSVTTGGFHNLAIKSDGTVVAWGLNANGQINIPEGLKSVVAIAAGSEHSLALKSDGTVVAWGIILMAKLMYQQI